MARKRNEITPAQLEELFAKVESLQFEIEEANTAIDNHVPDMEVADGMMSQCLWLAIEANKMAMRLRSIQRRRHERQEIDRLMARQTA